MEYDHNEHLETNNLIIITNKIKIISNKMFMFCVYVENTAMAS